ncbi:ABC transporter ATP-binding protein [Paenibacillus alkalitolerans]|uniref:ABC transporter ATP-binding protein n=1 Tax=Paenibacillus alkalitolerans TaxID=2799335 RepID=UPI0018F5F294|nr:ABC transporter ATP-binding protein [Paenibacillus alkalitolerans]
MSEAVIQTNGLTKDYGNGRGCRNITLTVRAGEAFGFLGPNGAGKSTLVKMLVGLIRPTAGQASLFGAQAGTIEARRHIGYLPELYRYQEWLTGEEVLWLHAKLCNLEHSYAKKRIAELLEEVGIGLRGRDRIKHYSKGMQQRLGFACAMISDPKLLFLDEPSSAMDPVGRHEVRQLLQKLRKQGKTIFLNSHLLEDVEVLCDRVALLNNGEIMAQGSVEEVLQEKNRWQLRVGGLTPLHLEWLRETTGLPMKIASIVSLQTGDLVWLEAQLKDDEQIGWLNSLIVEQGMTLYEVNKAKNRLDEWFVNAVSGLNHRGERA